MLKEKRKGILICFPHADECMQFQIPDVKVMLYFLWMCMQKEEADMERSFWLAAGLQLLHRPRGFADAAQEKRNDS